MSTYFIFRISSMCLRMNCKLLLMIIYTILPVNFYVFTFCQTVVRALQNQEERLKQQVVEVKSELKEIEFNIESMNVNIREPAAVGRGKSVCGNCHHRGHRNQATKPCVLNKCTDYTYCGIKEKHPEFFSKLNALKLQRRKKENAILDLESQINLCKSFRVVVSFSLSGTLLHVCTMLTLLIRQTNAN